MNAYDNGTNNDWDNGLVGNYWHDYDGCDDNNDGIGKQPYLIEGTANSQDNCPFTDVECDDGGDKKDDKKDDKKSDEDEPIGGEITGYALIFPFPTPSRQSQQLHLYHLFYTYFYSVLL